MSDASPGGGEQQGCRRSSTASSSAQPDASAPSNADDVELPSTPDGGTPRRARTFSDSCEWSPSFFNPPEGFGCTNLGDGSDGLGFVHVVHGEAAQLTTVREESPGSPPPREGAHDVGAPLPTPHRERVPPADTEASEDEEDEPPAPCRLSLDLTLEDESDEADRDAAADAPCAEAAAAAADDAASDAIAAAEPGEVMGVADAPVPALRPRMCSAMGSSLHTRPSVGAERGTAAPIAPPTMSERRSSSGAAAPIQLAALAGRSSRRSSSSAVQPLTAAPVKTARSRSMMVSPSTGAEGAAAEAPDAEAPDVWERHHSEDGRAYLHNRRTRTSVWDYASAVAGGDAAPGAEHSPAGEGEPAAEWCSCVDDAGRTYYCNLQTRETAWELPAGVNAAEVQSSTTDAAHPTTPGCHAATPSTDAGSARSVRARAPSTGYIAVDSEPQPQSADGDEESAPDGASAVEAAAAAVGRRGVAGDRGGRGAPLACRLRCARAQDDGRAASRAAGDAAGHARLDRE